MKKTFNFFDKAYDGLSFMDRLYAGVDLGLLPLQSNPAVEILETGLNGLDILNTLGMMGIDGIVRKDKDAVKQQIPELLSVGVDLIPYIGDAPSTILRGVNDYKDLLPERQIHYPKYKPDPYQRSSTYVYKPLTYKYK